MAIHFNKKTVVVILVIMAMIFFNRRYYFYCIDNAYYEYSVDNKLEYYYGDYKFGHLGKKVNVFKEDDLYRFEYIASMSDGDIQFDVIKNMYDTKRLGGHSYRDDYWGARDNYLRKKLEKQGIDLEPYEVDFREAAACDEPDCRFVLSEGDNEKEIVVITEIMRYGINNEYKLDFWFKAYKENGDEIASSYDLMKKCEGEKITESDLRAFIERELHY